MLEDMSFLEGKVTGVAILTVPWLDQAWSLAGFSLA
jgi:hypothetical protein